MEVLADQLDNAGDIGGIHAGFLGLSHHVDYTGKAHLVYHGPHRVLYLHGKGFVVLPAVKEMLGIEDHFPAMGF